MSNELMEVRNEQGMLGLLETAAVDFCSFHAETEEEKKVLYNAMNNPDKRIEEVINIPINIRDVYAEQLEFIDEKTGEVMPGVRIVLIDTDGVSYGCASKGIYSALCKLFKVFGKPTWENGITVIPITQQSRRENRKIYTLKLA